MDKNQLKKWSSQVHPNSLTNTHANKEKQIKVFNHKAYDKQSYWPNILNFAAFV